MLNTKRYPLHAAKESVDIALENLHLMDRSRYHMVSLAHDKRGGVERAEKERAIRAPIAVQAVPFIQVCFMPLSFTLGIQLDRPGCGKAISGNKSVK